MHRPIFLVLVAACQGADGVLTAVSGEAGSEATAAAPTTSAAPMAGSTSAESGSADGSSSAGAGSSGADATSTSGTTTTTSASSTTGGDESSSSGTTGEAFCVANPDCPEGMVCVQSCDDDCDQTMFPNPCCVRDCTPFEPLVCDLQGGNCEVQCPGDTYEAANQERWVCAAQGTRCCLPPVTGCDQHMNRFLCESQATCAWVLLDCEVENCAWPDMGTCEPA